MILLNKAKNYIINGAFDFWQRGSSFNVSGGYTTDRYVIGKAGTMVCNAFKDTSTIPTLAQSGFTYPSSLGMTVSTTQPSLATNDNVFIYQRIEGSLFASLAGKTMTFSFWVRTSPSAAGTYTISLKNANVDRSYVSTFTVDNSGLWQRKSITLTHDLTGVWNYGNGTGVIISICLASGSSQHAPSLNTWLSGNYSSHSSASNFAASTSNTFNITGIQLEEGIEASNFERAGGNVVNELMLCQRYFEKTYPVDTSLGTISTDSALVTRSSGTDAGACDVSWHYKVPKRVLPSGVIYNPSTGVVGTWTGTGTPAATINVGINSSRVYSSGTSVANSNYSIHATADAEL